jgi:MFS superfamily sulfate permease-like transporter
MSPSARLGIFAADVRASVVVFLVALPLCLGIALASGVPPALGLVTGIVGGLVVGAVQGTPISVSGPAAGLTVIVFELVREHGIVFMSTVVLAAGALQAVVGIMGGGRWFRAVPPAVVHGMLAGIGLLIAAGQGHTLLGDRPRGDGLRDLLTLPEALLRSLDPGGSPTRLGSTLIGALTIAILVAWPRLAPHRLRALPAPLVAVGVSTGAANAFGLTVAHVEIPSRLLSAVALPSSATIEHLTSGVLWVAAVELALVASAETLLCAVAVDRMHSGPRTNPDRELVAQGIGNTACGLVGALPMTAVIVRSSANLRAGARSRASTMLHGAWLLLLVAVVPQILRLVPVASLAGVLVVVGCQLIDRTALAQLSRVGKTEVAIYLVTIVGVVATDLLKGVLAGLAVAAVVLLHRLTHLRVEVEHDTGTRRSVLHLHGSATFIRLPKLIETLDGMPPDRELHVRLNGLAHMDHAALELIASWEQAQRERGRTVVIDLSDVPATAGRAEVHGEANR